MRVVAFVGLALFVWAAPAAAQDVASAGTANTPSATGAPSAVAAPPAAPAPAPVTPVADGPYSRDARIRSIATALKAVRSINKVKLLNTYTYLVTAERSLCRAEMLSLKVECLMQAAKKSCRGDRRTCQIVSDVIISNRIGENSLISQEEKLDLMKAQGGGTFRERFEKELRRRYASLVLEMKLKWPAEDLLGDKLAGTIEAYCREVSSTKALAWQHCASAIVWFVATSERAEIPGKEKR